MGGAFFDFYPRWTRADTLSSGKSQRWASSSSSVGDGPPSSSSSPAPKNRIYPCSSRVGSPQKARRPADGFLLGACLPQTRPGTVRQACICQSVLSQYLFILHPSISMYFSKIPPLASSVFSLAVFVSSHTTSSLDIPILLAF